MQHPTEQSHLGRTAVSVWARVGLTASALALVGLTGFWVGHADASPQAAAPSALAAPMDYNTLRVYGYPVVSNRAEAPFANDPATAGANGAVDALTGRRPEDPAYRDLHGPFDPLSVEAPEMDFVTWNPAWISERLDDATLRANWPGLTGVDEVSRQAHIRAGSVDASEKVWRRHWYEPTHLDKDLNADGRLTDADNDGVPDAPVNPTANNVDEWYPAIMTEFTYMLVDNDPLPQRNPAPSQLNRSAPRPVCGTTGQTQFVFPIGVARAELNPAGPLEGYGLTRLDANFDGQIDMVSVSDEAQLVGTLNGTRVDFDGDGAIEPINPDGAPLSCDELAVFHTSAFAVQIGQPIQFLDHFVVVRSVTDSAAVLEVWYNGDLVPRLLQARSVGIGATVLAGENGPMQVLAPGDTNLGNVPTGPWFAYLEDADPADGTAVLMVGRALGAPCASMEANPNQANRVRGGPGFLKRFYVDGHEYNTVAIATCSTDRFQYITLRAPLPKLPVIIEQHSVRLQSYPTLTALPQLPPFNYEHTILEDIRSFQRFPNVEVPPDTVPPVINRPNTIYMGGPIGPVAPVLARNEALPYTGRGGQAVGPYNDSRAVRWFYSDESRNPQAIGQLREKYGAVRPDVEDGPSIDQDSFFYNEQIWTMPWHFTEFVLPNHPEAQILPPPYDADQYHVTSAFISPTARWRRWTMPSTGVPASIPPVPPDLTVNATPDGGFPLGSPRRAVFWFSPDLPAQDPVKLWTDEGGVRLFGGQPERPDFPCDPERPSLYGTNNGAVAGAAAGDRRITSDAVSVALLGQANYYPVEVLPYTDPFAAFNPQHDHAPPGDSLTVNPAYMDEFRNFNEDLRHLYGQISNNEQNAREKVYHRMWYEPDYIDKIREPGECDTDLRFPALMQEYTFLYMDTTDNPQAATPGNSRFAFPIGTRAGELPAPGPGGVLPAGGEFGYGLTTFDANFDDFPEAVTVHSEATLAQYLDTQWQSHRPTIPGFPLPVVQGPELDFDGDGFLDNLDADARPLNGNELVVFAVESLVLDLDTNSPESSNAMILDHMVQLENVTRGSRAQFRFWFTGGNGTNARPEQVNGVRSLEIGDAAIVDRFQNRITVVKPGEVNAGTDGGWFVFVEDVAADADRVTVTVGRALGATHSAIDDGHGGHDLLPGDPWYLKRFYVDGHEYNVVAVMTQAGGPGNVPNFEFITIRTPVPKGNFLNSQDTLFLQGYFLDGLPPTVSVMPPFNVQHTIALDVERMGPGEFANTRQYDPCVGPLASARPLVVNIVAESREPRYGTELLELFDRDTSGTVYRWQTDQVIVTPNTYTEVRVPAGQQYLYTSNWRSRYSRLHFYGCTRITPPPFPAGVPGLNHQQLAELAADWSSPPPWAEPPNLLAPPNIIPFPNQLNPNQPIPPPIVLPGEPPVYARYFDARLGGPTVRVKVFYDPQDPNDWYINRRNLDYPEPGGTPTPTPTGTRPTATATAATATATVATATATVATATATVATPTATVATRTPTPGGNGAPFNARCQVVNTFQIQVSWTDGSTFETEFLVEISVNGAPFAPIIPPVPSSTQATTGQLYQYTTPNLAASTSFTFRVQARNPGTGQTSPYSNTTGVCQTGSAGYKAGCFKGKISLQGRTDHAGTLIYIDGMPMTTTASDGRWEVCGMTMGNHSLLATGACYLPVAGDAYMPQASYVQMPHVDLPGGDVNNNRAVDLFDLVRVGADYRSAPPNDTEADCNRDNVINLFDLVMVGTNYGDSGPVPWSRYGQPVDPPMLRAPNVTELARVERGPADGAPVALDARPLQDGSYAVDVLVHQVRGMYGADIKLAFDPTRVEVLDSLDKPGLQIEPGAAWEAGGNSFIPRNTVDAKNGQVVFTATLVNPAEPLDGDVRIATVKIKPLDGTDGKGALALTSVSLAGKPPAGPIAVRWEGVDVFPLIDVNTLVNKVFLPFAHSGRE